MKHEGSVPGSEDPTRGLDERQRASLEHYEQILATRGACLGLVSRNDLARIHDRHVVDGLRAMPHVPADATSAVDLGSGSGIPGIPVAIALPGLTVVLAEVRRARAAFLEYVVAELALANASTHAGRAEDLAADFDVCLARAFAPPHETWETAKPLLRRHGVLIYWAGERFAAGRDAPEDAIVTVPPQVPLASGGPVVIMSPR